MNKPKNASSEPARDICQTPGYAVEPLLRELRFHKDFILWECASGEGILSGELERQGITVFETDTDWDFLREGQIQYPNPEIHYIVTNPPFSKKDLFTRRCLEYHQKYSCGIALLMPSESVSTKWFCELVNEFGNPGIIWFNPRVNFKMPNKAWKGSSSQFPVAWFTWGWFEGNRFVRMDHWTKEYRKRFEI